MTHLVEIRGLTIRFTGERTSSYPPLEGEGKKGLTVIAGPSN